MPNLTAWISAPVDFEQPDPGNQLLKGKDMNQGVSLVYSLPLDNTTEQMWIAQYQFRKNLAVRFIEQDDGTYSSSFQHSMRFGKKPLQKSDPQPTKVSLQIGKVTIVNHSAISDGELIQQFKIKEGDAYDSWKLQEKLFELKAYLQKLGYLFPSVSVQEDKRDDSIYLRVSVDPGKKRKILLEGIEPDTKRLSQYERWWREGFTEQAILSMMEQDLLRGLWKDGFHKAKLELFNDPAGDVRVKLMRGARFSDVQIVIKDPSNKDLDKIRKELDRLSGSPQDTQADALHDFLAFRTQLQLACIRAGYFYTNIVEGGTVYQGVGIRKEVFLRRNGLSRIAHLSIGKEVVPEDLLEQLKLREGELFDATILPENELNIARYYEDRGYLAVRAQGKPSLENGALALSYELTKQQPARIRNIRIQGNHHTDSATIEDRASF